MVVRPAWRGTRTSGRGQWNSPPFVPPIFDSQRALTLTCQNSSSRKMGRGSPRLTSWLAAMTESSSARRRAIRGSETRANVVPRLRNWPWWLECCMPTR